MTNDKGLGLMKTLCATLLLAVSASVVLAQAGGDIVSNQIMPEDFDRFWADARAEVASVPMDGRMVKLESGDPKVELFDVTVACAGGAPVRGYFAVPKDKRRKYPLVMNYDSFGVRSCRPQALGDGNMIFCQINAHGVENGKPEEFYRDLFATTLKDYHLRSWGEPRKNYFRGMFQRVMRAQEYAESLPDWDGKNLWVRGASQGGAQAFAAAALDPRVTVVMAQVPALCDLDAMEVGRKAGWPFQTLSRRRHPPAMTAYFDSVNFARKIGASTACFVAVGLLDPISTPSSVVAAYNALDTKDKKLFVAEKGGHGFPMDNADWRFARAHEK